MILAIRWGVTAVLLAYSLLAVVRVHSLRLWMLSIGAKEYGHWFALLTPLPLVGLSLKGSATWPLLAAAALATGLFLLSAVRASLLARDLEQRLGRAFGPLPPQSPRLAPPFRWRTLWLGDRALPSVTLRRFTYARRGGQDMSLSLIRPAEAKPLPCIVAVHSGGWDSGSSDEFLAFHRLLASSGYAVAAIDYRLAPEWTWPAAKEDALEAVNFLQNQGRELGIDSNRIVLMGRSAGGQIAEAAAFGGANPAIRGCIAFYAPADLEFAYAFGREDDCLNSLRLLRQYVGGTPDEKRDAYRDASPIGSVNAGTPPVLLLHGAPDPLVWVRQSERLAERLAGAAVRHLFVRLSWATHGFDFNPNGPGGQLARYAVGYFLAAALA